MNPGDLVYKKTGSALARIVGISNGTAAIEYLYTIAGAKHKAGDKEMVPVDKLIPAPTP